MTASKNLTDHLVTDFIEDIDRHVHKAREVILNRLQSRKKNEQKPFEDVCSLAITLSDRAYTLEKENNELRSRLLSLQDMLLAGGSDTAREMYSRLSDLPTNRPTIQHEKKITELQEDLKNALKTNSDNTQTILELKTQLNDRNSMVSQLKAALDEKNSEIAILKKDLETIKDENLALSISYKGLEKKNYQLSIDYDSLRRQVLEKKRESADRLNAENEKEMKERMRKEIETNVAELDKIQLAKRVSGDPSSVFLGNMPEDLDELLEDKLVAHIPNRVNLTFDGHEGETCALYWYYRNGVKDNFLATGGSYDRKVKIWKVEDEKSTLIHTLLGSNASINSIDVDGNFILAASNDMAARVWSINDQRIRVTLTGHSAKVMSAKFMNQPTRAATCSSDRTVKIWDTSVPACLRTYFAGSHCLDLLYTHNQVVSCHFDGIVRCWDLRKTNHDPAGEIKLQSKVTSLDISNDAMKLICSIRDNTLKCVDLRRMEVLQTYFDERFRLATDTCRAKFSNDSQYVACGSMDGSMFIWDANTTKIEKVLTGPSSAILACCWSPDGTRMASIEKGKKVSIWL